MELHTWEEMERHKKGDWECVAKTRQRGGNEAPELAAALPCLQQAGEI